MPVLVSILPHHLSSHSVIDSSDPYFIAQSDSSRVDKTFQYVISNLPSNPTGPPPGFGTREEWLQSLPAWRKNKPRQTSQDQKLVSDMGLSEYVDFNRGLIDTRFVSVSKGGVAEACSPPVPSNPKGLREGFQYPNMYGVLSVRQTASTGLEAPPSSVTAIGMAQPLSLLALSPDRGDDSPISPSPRTPDSLEVWASTTLADPENCPTPFAEHVDRAFAEAAALSPQPAYVTRSVCKQPTTQECSSLPLEPILNPLSMRSYRAMAEPLSDWLALYIWRVCTTGLSLRPEYSNGG